MPDPIFVSIIIVVTLLGSGVLLAFWNDVADLVKRYVMPLLEKYLPELKPIASKVFRTIDQIAVSVVQKIKKNWAKLKQGLIGQLIYYERKSANRYVQRVVTYLRKKLESGKVQYYKVQSEPEPIDPIDIPPQFREEVIGLDAAEVNTTDHLKSAIKEMVKRAK